MNHKDIPQEWIKIYVDELINLAKTLEDGSLMQEQVIKRATHILDLVEAFRETQHFLKSKEN